MPPVPIVKVARHDQGRIGRHTVFDTLTQSFQLAAAAARCQRKMHAYVMQRLRPTGNGDLGMQEATALEAMRRYIQIFPAHDGKARQDRIAMIAMVVHRVAAVDPSIALILRVYRRKKLVLRGMRPIAMAMRMPVIAARNFLQENYIGIQPAQLVAQRMDHHAPVEYRQPFVDIAGGNTQMRGRLLLKAHGA